MNVETRQGRFQSVLLSLMGRYVGVLGPDGLTLLAAGSGFRAFRIHQTLKKPVKHPPKRVLLIVGREHYFELNHFFPISSHKDLARAIPFEAPDLCPEAFTRYAYLPHPGPGGTRVTLWFFREAVRPWIEWLSPWAIIPESALLGLSREQNAGSIHGSRRWGRWILAFQKQDGALLSKVFPVSLPKQGAMARFQRFGGFEAGQARVIMMGEEAGDPDPAYLSTLTGKLQHLPLQWWRRFLYLEKFRPKRISRPFLYAQATLILLFFLLPWLASMFHIQAVHEQLLTEVRKTAPQVGRYQEMDRQIQTKMDLVENMNAPLREYVPRSLALNYLAQVLHPDKDILQSIRIVDQRMELRGETLSSSDLLSRLNEWSGFSQGRFSMPVRKDDRTGRERFAIEVILQPPAPEQ